MLIFCVVMAALNFSFVLVFIPTGHDDVGQRLTHFVARHYLIQDQRPFVWAFDILLDRLPFQDGIVPESFLRMTFLVSVIWMTYGAYASFQSLFNNRRTTIAALLTIFFVTFPSLEELSRFSANAIPYFLSTGLTFVAFRVLRAARSGFLGVAILTVGLSGHQMNGVLFLGLLLLEAFIDRAYLAPLAIRRCALHRVLPLVLAFIGYQGLLYVLSYTIYGRLPTVASWRNPQEVTSVSDVLVNFGQFWHEALSTESLFQSAFYGLVLISLLAAAIVLASSRTRPAGFYLLGVVTAALGLYFLNFAPTLVYGISTPSRALFAAALSFSLIFVALDQKAAEFGITRKIRVLMLLVPAVICAMFIGSNLLNSHKNAEHFRSQYRKMLITMETIDALEGSERIQEVIIFADEFEPPFITKWIEPNIRYYFGERSYDFSVKYRDHRNGETENKTMADNAQASVRKKGKTVYVEW
jgi:hypothetical protein